jgi:mRNA interferase RelE/StbE
MAYSIRFLPSAQKEFEALPKQIQARVSVAIDGLSQNPRPNGCKKLKGQDDSYRIRIGDRVLYKIYDKQLVVIIVKIASRGGAHK